MKDAPFSYLLFLIFKDWTHKLFSQKLLIYTGRTK